MKHLWLIMLLVLALLCGCGSAAPAAGTSSETAAAPVASAQPEKSTPRVIGDDASKSAAPTAAPAAGTPEPAAQAEAETDPQMQAAIDCIGETTDALYAAIGYPESSDYASSCLGSGEDGNLYYDGFTVYTYRENGVETVRHVE